MYRKGLAHEALGQDAAAADHYRAVLLVAGTDEMALEVRQRLEPIQLRRTPWELISATSVSWRQDPASRQVVHTVRLTNQSSRRVGFPRLRVEYVNRKSRALGSEEAVLALRLAPGESRTVPGVGGWTVAGEVHQVAMQVMAITTLP